MSLINSEQDIFDASPPTRTTSAPGRPREGLFSRVGVRYEVAQDVIGSIISYYAYMTAQEREKPARDESVVALYEFLMFNLWGQRDALHIISAEIEACIAYYAPRARATLFGVEDAQRHSRRLQFAQANASLALSGHMVSGVDLAIQDLIIVGVLSADEAVQLLRQFYASRA